MPFHPAKPAVEGITLCHYSRFRKAFLFRPVLKHTLNFNDTLNSHLNMLWSATFEFAPLWATLWGPVTCSYWKVYFMAPRAKLNLKSLFRKVRWLADVTSREVSFVWGFSGLWGYSGVAICSMKLPRNYKWYPFYFSLSRKDIWINNISLIQ